MHPPPSSPEPPARAFVRGIRALGWTSRSLLAGIVFLGCFARTVDLPGGFPPSGRVAENRLDSLVAWQWVDPRSDRIDLFWKDDTGGILGDLGRLKSFVESRGDTLLAAMNGGMFDTGFSAHGLFIQDGVQLHALDTGSGPGNFYLKPNGVFFVDSSGMAAIATTDRFRDSGGVRHATQSGPMLVIDGTIHPAFVPGSRSLNIRNGVGIRADGTVLLAISRVEVNLHDFATFFLRKGCTDALYLDGFVSRAYLPDRQWEQTDGELGVLIGVTRTRHPPEHPGPSHRTLRIDRDTFPE